MKYHFFLAIFMCGFLTLAACGDKKSASRSLIPTAPNPIPALRVITTQPQGSRLAARVSHTCAVLQTGTLRCWGANDQGQITVPPDLGLILP